MPLWLEDIVHEIGTVVAGLVLWFWLSVLVGYLLRGRVSLLTLRLVALSSALVGSFFSLDTALGDSFELGFTLGLFLLAFLWGLLIGFEGRRIYYKEFLLIGFWFAKNVKRIH